MRRRDGAAAAATAGVVERIASKHKHRQGRTAAPAIGKEGPCQERHTQGEHASSRSL